ncbi:MerR family transcriptional regulator [Shewanella youngdeokensis]|uniref:MerR family transcriptional regulator n=1 Tax=Shewanella youngdeokensis TaxID=2999068 RepID=A0ABZ0K1U4_9GAMM|nr:MerR family transcriptional regulator [Shewanella sp. DAU334]
MPLNKLAEPPVSNNAKWFSIGEAAEVTGVNPVTLRAWQRRFGLVIPKRTDKGHRLYSSQHLSQIKEILYWLNKGVAISKVKPLLNSSVRQVAANSLLQNAQLKPEEVSYWQANILFLNQCCIALDASALHKKLTELSAMYPFAILKNCLYWPWLGEYDNTMAERVDAAIVRAWVRSELAAYFSAPRLTLLQCSMPATLLVSIASEAHWSPLLLSAELSAYNIKHQPLQVSRLSELDLLTQRMAYYRILVIAHPQFSKHDTRALKLLMQTHPDRVHLVGIYAKGINQDLQLSHLSVSDIVQHDPQ